MPSSHEPDFEAMKALLDGERSMGHGEAMGAFVALYSAPRDIPPRRWLPVIFRERPPSEVDGPALSALMETYRQLGEKFEEQGVFAPDPESVQAVESFCRGYLAVMELDQDWLRAEEEFAFDLVALTNPSILDDPRITIDGSKAEWLAHARLELPDLLEEIYFKNRDREPGAAVQAVSKKVDRNAPCPCGSGRKYKKCCGAAA